MTEPAVTQQPTWGGDSLQIDNLGVLEGGCESDHARHVPAGVGEVVLGQAVSEWARASTLSGFRSVTEPAVTHSHESEHHSPQRLDVALLHALAKCSDALDGVGALAILIETAELVLIQTAARVIPSVRMCDMARCHTCSDYQL